LIFSKSDFWGAAMPKGATESGQRESNHAARLVVHQRIKPDPAMSIRAKKKWREIVNSLPADFFRVSDRSLFAVYCINAALHDEMTEIIDTEGALIDNGKGRKVPNPAIWVRAQAAQVMAQLSVKLRLAPSSRMDDRVAATKSNADANAKRPWDKSAA
jgi:P27 family predicted phage terminase small subunit